MPDCRYQLENYRNQNETKPKKAMVEALSWEQICASHKCEVVIFSLGHKRTGYSYRALTREVAGGTRKKPEERKEPPT